MERPHRRRLGATGVAQAYADGGGKTWRGLAAFDFLLFCFSLGGLRILLLRYPAFSRCGVTANECPPSREGGREQREGRRQRHLPMYKLFNRIHNPNCGP